MNDRPLSHRHLPAAVPKLDPREVHIRAPSHRAGLSLFLRYPSPGCAAPALGRGLSLVLASTLKAVARAAERIGEWRARARGRRELMSLDERTLQDIGLSRGDAYMEYSKPFWRK